MGKDKKITGVATACVGLLTVSFISCIMLSLDFFAYTEKLGLEASAALRAAYFYDHPFAPMFKYFVFAVMFLLVSTYYIAQLRLKLMGALSYVLVIWLTISALYEYYSLLNFTAVVVIGAILELIAIVLYVVLLTQKNYARPIP